MSPPTAGHMLADRSYDAVWYRKALGDTGIAPRIPSRKNCKVPILIKKPDTASATKLRTASPGSRTGDAAQRAATGAPKSSCRHAHRPQSSFFDH